MCLTRMSRNENILLLEEKAMKVDPRDVEIDFAAHCSQKESLDARVGHDLVCMTCHWYLQEQRSQIATIFWNLL